MLLLLLIKIFYNLQEKINQNEIGPETRETQQSQIFNKYKLEKKRRIHQ